MTVGVIGVRVISDSPPCVSESLQWFGGNHRSPKSWDMSLEILSLNRPASENAPLVSFKVKQKQILELVSGLCTQSSPP